MRVFTSVALVVACADPDEAALGPAVTVGSPVGDGTEPEPEPPIDLVFGDRIEICLNEIMPSNQHSARDERGSTSDWIELHNPTDEDLALDGWTLTDDPEEQPDLHRLDGLVLEAGGFLVLWADGDPDAGLDHLGFALSDEGETVALFAPDHTGSVVRFGPVPGDLALRRETDCCFELEGCFGYTSGGTPGAPNE